MSGDQNNGNVIQNMQAFGNAANGAVSGWNSFWGSVWGFISNLPMIILGVMGGGALLNMFHNQSWLEPVMRFFAPWVQTFLGWLPEGPIRNFFNSFLGNFAQYVDAEGAQNALATFTDRELAEEVIRDGEEGERDFAIIQRAMGATRDGAADSIGRGNVLGLAFNKNTVAALLRDRVEGADNDGQEMIRRLAPTLGRRLRAPATPANGEEQSDNTRSNPITEAFLAFLNDRELFARTVDAEGVMDTLCALAQEVGGIQISNDAKTALAGLPAEMRRQLFTAFVGENGTPNTQEVSRALMTMVNAPETEVPSASIHALLTGITTPALTESATAEQRSMHQTLTQLRTLDVAQITTLRTNIRELGPELVESFINQPVATLVNERANEDLTPARLASLLSLAPADVVSPELSRVISTEQGARELLGVVDALETEPGSFVGLMGAFDYLRDHPAPPAAATDATPETRAAQLRTYHQERAPHIRTIARALVNPEVRAFIAAHPEMLPEGTAGMLTNFLPRNVAEADAFAAIISRGDEVFNSAEGNVRETFIEGVTEAVSDSHNFTNLLDLLFKDELREHLLEDEAMQSAIVTIAAQEPVQPASTQRGYDERTVRALLAGNSSATAINTHNLEALVNLVNTIDDATGGGQNEDAADARNQRVVNFFLRLAANQQPAVNDELAEDFSVLFRDQRVVEAVQNYLGERGTGEGGIQLEGFTEAQQAFIRALRDNLWIDDNNNGTIDRRQDGFDIAFDADAGLAPYLASRSSAMNILHAITGNNGILGFHSESWWSDMAIPLDWLNGPLSRIKTTSEAVDRERDALPATVSGGVEVAETECRPVPGQPTVTYCGWPGNRNS